MADELTALWDRLDTLVGYSVPRTLDGIAAAWPEGWWINGGRLRPGVWDFIAGPDAAGAATHRSGEASTRYEAELRLVVDVYETIANSQH